MPRLLAAFHDAADVAFDAAIDITHFTLFITALTRRRCRHAQRVAAGGRYAAERLKARMPRYAARAAA